MQVVVTKNGDIITIPLSITNNGGEAATNVTTPIVAPSGLTFYSIIAGSGSYSAITGNWTIPSLPDAATGTLTIKAQVTDISKAPWTLVFESDADEVDLELENNVVEITVVDCSPYQTCIDSLAIGDTNLFNTNLDQDTSHTHDANSFNTEIHNVGSFIVNRGNQGTTDNFYRLSATGFTARGESGTNSTQLTVSSTQGTIDVDTASTEMIIRATSSGTDRVEMVIEDTVTGAQSLFQGDITRCLIVSTDASEQSQIIAEGNGTIRLDSTTGDYVLGDAIGGNLPPTDNALTDIIVIDSATGELHIRTVASLGIGVDTNWFTDDLTLAEPREHELDGNTLLISGTGAGSEFEVAIDDGSGSLSGFQVTEDSVVMSHLFNSGSEIRVDSSGGGDRVVLSSSDGIYNIAIAPSSGGSASPTTLLLARNAGTGNLESRSLGTMAAKELTINEYQVAEAVAAAAQGQTIVVVPASFNGMNLTAAIAAVHTLGASTGGETVDINILRRRAGANVSMLSTPITLNDLEYFAADGVIDAANDDVATGDVLSVSVVNAFDTTDPMGLTITLTFELP